MNIGREVLSALTLFTPFSRPTRDPGWEFSLGGDFFPPSNFDRRVGGISPPPPLQNSTGGWGRFLPPLVGILPSHPSK